MYQDTKFQPLSDNIVEAAICERGDRTPAVVADTVDIRHVLTCFVTGPEAEGAKREQGSFRKTPPNVDEAKPVS